jgi:surface polysaccharide O-acyltransferase-like enzyme
MRNASIEYLKLTLSIMVVGIHTLLFKEISPYLSYIFVNGIFRIAVPIFFIISGFYFYHSVSMRGFYLWFKRMFLLYLIWMVIYLPYYFPKDISSINNILYFLFKLCFGYHHLWYLIGSVGAACILQISKKQSDFFIMGFAISMFLIGVTLQYMHVYCDFDTALIRNVIGSINSFRNFVFFGFPMFAIGYLIAKNHISHLDKNKYLNSRLILLLLILALFLESSINFYLLPFSNGFDIYISLLFLAPYLFFYATRSNSTIQTSLISKNSVGIYLCHPLIYDALMKLFNLEYGTLLFAITFPLSVIFSLVLIKIDRKTGFIL